MNTPQPGDKIAVYFSCGAASFKALQETIRLYGDTCEVIAVNNPIKEEDADNQRFRRDVERLLNIKIQTAINSKYKSCSCVEVWDDRSYMSGTKGAPCTLELKKRARYEWEIKNRPDWTVMGYTKEEADRFTNFQTNERQSALFVLKDITRVECFLEVARLGLKLPRAYEELGMPNANCVGCVKATSPTYWNHIRKVAPQIFAERAKQSREIGCRLVRVKGKRLFLDELDPLAKGRPMKTIKIECGIFCTN